MVEIAGSNGCEVKLLGLEMWIVVDKQPEGHAVIYSTHVGISIDECFVSRRWNGVWWIEASIFYFGPSILTLFDVFSE